MKAAELRIASPKWLWTDKIAFFCEFRALLIRKNPQPRFVVYDRERHSSIINRAHWHVIVDRGNKFRIRRGRQFLQNLLLQQFCIGGAPISRDRKDRAVFLHPAGKHDRSVVV